ncbi:uncharacterized protein [Henckelia pumila]|uniref:uncharacterized protein n=1 Tax=Henckelia pumila TaxID=405737 RepID=UPI003C6E5CAD
MAKMKFHVKAIVVKGRKKVLYAEVENKLVDVLLSFLTLPLGTIVRLLVKYYESREAPIIGSLNSLYRGLETMNIGRFFRVEDVKMMLLQPRNPFELEIDKLHARKCIIGKYFDSSCGLLMNKKVAPMEDLYNQLLELHYCQPLMSQGESVSTKSLSSFILGDDLQILPNDPQSRSQILRQHQVEDKDMLEEMSFFWGFQQIMALLEGSLLSKTPLSNIIFRTPWQMRNDVSPVVKSKQNSLMGKTSWRVTLKVYVQSSTKRVVFIESSGDFVEILFGFLAFSLGTAHRLCNGDCGLGSIGNLYHSASRLDMKLLAKKGLIYRFLSKMKLPYAYESASLKNFQVKDPKEGENFLKTPILVMEDLEVSTTPASAALSTMNRLKISVWDIQRQELEIGVEEVSCLLKAALHSKCALTDGLQRFLK